MPKTIVITGGTSGIGLATAEHFAALGWNVAVLARDEERLSQTASRLRSMGIQALALRADVADSAAVDAAAAQVEQALGPIDAWVNNAMLTVLAPAQEITAAEYAKVTATTYLGQVHGTLAALRCMRSRGRGAIVQVSSGLAIRSIPLQAAYCGAKFAVSGFTDALRAELIAENLAVSLTVVYLPGVNTPQPTYARNRTGHRQIIPDPLYDPRVCARAIASAIEHPQREIWVGRSTVGLAVAQAVSPALSDRLASKAWKMQLGSEGPDKEGNLDRPAQGRSRIDGDESARVVDRPNDFYTSAQRDVLKGLLVGGLLGVGLALGLALPRRSSLS